MQDILAELVRVRGVGGCLILDQDGLVIDSMLRQDVDAQALAATLSGLIASLEQLCQGLRLGQVTSFASFSDQGGFLLCAAGPARVLVLCDAQASLSLLRLEVKPFLDRIGKRLAL